MKRKFSIRMVGCFYANELYDKQGRHVYTLQEAIDAANELYDGHWAEVYNGQEAHSRDDVCSDD